MVKRNSVFNLNFARQKPKAQLVVTAHIAQRGIGVGCSPYVTALFLNLFLKLMHSIDVAHNSQFSRLARLNKVIHGVFTLKPRLNGQTFSSDMVLEERVLLFSRLFGQTLFARLATATERFL